MRIRSHEHAFLHGYTDRLSVPQGGKIGFCVSTDLANFGVKIARIGIKRRTVWSQQGIVGIEHAIPDDAAQNGCDWPVSFSVDIGSDWPSGYYHVLLYGQDSNGNSVQGEASFVVRSAFPGRDTPILFQRPTNTEAAYNSWGGYTFYNGPDGPARRLSFDRPFAGFPSMAQFRFTMGTEFVDELDSQVTSQALTNVLKANGIAVSPYSSVQVECPGKRWHILDVGFLSTIEKNNNRLIVFDGFSTWLSCWHHWERHFVFWAEQQGYNLDYAVNSDLEYHPEILSDYRLVLSVGHDEYWSAPMRDNLEGFIDTGGNVAFLSGNVCWWQVRSEDNGRTIVCYKEDYKTDDPNYACGDHATLSTLWCNRLIGRPENQLTGVSFAYGGYHGFFSATPQTGAYTVHRPEHWLFNGTGLEQNDLLGEKDQIVSYECDGCEIEIVDGLPAPTFRDGTPETFQVLATAPAALSDADDSISMATEAIYGVNDGEPLASGNAVLGTYTRNGTVVTTGCTDWCMGLAGNDPNVCLITRNILDGLSKHCTKKTLS